MPQKIVLQPVCLLHYRPYRDTSLLVDLFSRDHGRISAIARGVRGPKSRHRGLLQPFTSLFVSWFGKSELVTLNVIEPNGAPYYLTGNRLLSGLYLNELLVRALHQGDPHPALYDTYIRTLAALSQSNSSIENILRIFEKRLLQETGYGLSLQQTTGTKDTIQPDQFYAFDPQHGFTWVPETGVTGMINHPPTFVGNSLLALETEVLSTSQHLLDAKRLMRMALRPIIGHKPLRSRELFLYAQ
jgi:DNA repair protein RecO (recombination protein O)